MVTNAGSWTRSAGSLRTLAGRSSEKSSTWTSWATKENATLYAEAKGRTEAIGVDVDTLYGQLLRRVPEEAPNALLGVVVPERAVPAALRVPGWVRDRLRVTIWAVADDGAVRQVAPPADD